MLFCSSSWCPCRPRDSLSVLSLYQSILIPSFVAPSSKESRHLPSSCVQCNGKGGPLYPLASLTVFVQSSCVVRLPCRRRPRRKNHRCSSSSLSFIVMTVDVYALASVHLRVCPSSSLFSWSSSLSSCVLGPDMRTVFGRFVKRVSPFTIRLGMVWPIGVRNL